jgi:alanine racemase
MGTGRLTIDLDALAANWRALDAASGSSVQTGATVKADGYGLGVAQVARALADAGARRFFVAVAEEGARLRKILGDGPQIAVYSGHMAGDTDMIRDASLTPMLNSVEQVTRHFEALPEHPFGIQLDTGMNRLGMKRAEWAALASIVLEQRPELVMSHLACADEPENPMNPWQLDQFRQLTDGIGVPRSLSATGGVLLGSDYHFDLTRPGIGLYGGLPFEQAQNVVRLSLPVIQTHRLEPGETVGYGCTWQTDRPAVTATLAAGYADGLIRAMGNRATVFAGDTPCPVVGRVSMDLTTVDVSHLDDVPDALDILCVHQTVDDLADAAATIGYEILTSLGQRYARSYRGAAAG